MEDWLQTLFGWLPEGGVYYFLIGAVAFLESIVVIGILVPGSVITVFAGFLALHGKGELAPVMSAAACGAIAGDMLSFWLGVCLGPELLHRRLLRRHLRIVRRAENFFASHGGKSVFFGRFIGPIRGFIPFVAGGARMSPGFFALYTLISGILWGLFYPGLGYLGGASWRQVQILSGRFSLIILILLSLFILDGLFWKKAAPGLAKATARRWESLRSFWLRFLETPGMRQWIGNHPRLWGWLAKRLSLQRGTGMYLTAGLATSASFAVLFFWLVGKMPLLDRLDALVHGSLRDLHHPWADIVLKSFASLGDGTVILLSAGFLLSWLILNNRDFSALILIVGLGGGELILRMLHFFFRLPEPALLAPKLQVIFSVLPIGHSFFAAMLCGLTIYFLLGTVNQWRSRLGLLTGGSFLVLLIAFSRIYFGMERLSGVLAGFALAALWLTFLLTASEMRRRYAGEFPWRSGWELLRFSPRTRTILLLIAALGFSAAIALHVAAGIK